MEAKAVGFGYNSWEMPGVIFWEITSWEIYVHATQNWCSQVNPLQYHPKIPLSTFKNQFHLQFPSPKKFFCLKIPSIFYDIIKGHQINRTRSFGCARRKFIHAYRNNNFPARPSLSFHSRRYTFTSNILSIVSSSHRVANEIFLSV
jgi:hypothetical protein